jgi:ATP-binding cassette subfamily C (CFTR/MRP) protein 1
VSQVGYLRPLEPTDIPLVAPERSVSILAEKLKASFEKRRERGDPRPLLGALIEVFFREFWFSGACRLVGDVLLVINPFLLRYLIKFAVQAYRAKTLGTPEPNVGRGVGLAVGITVIQFVISVCVTQFVYNAMMVGGQARGAIISMAFEKALRISGRAKAGGAAAAAFTMRKSNPSKEGKEGKNGKEKMEEDGWSTGRVVNLMGTDSYRIDLAAGYFHIIWTAPIQIILTLILLLVNLGVSALAGFGILVLVSPALAYVVKILAARRRVMNVVTDKRITLTQEIFSAVRFVKYFGWEESFLSRLSALRDQEIRSVQFLLGIRSGVNAVGLSLPVFASMLAFVTYSLTHTNLDPANVFSSLALFNALRMPLNMLPTITAFTIDAWVSLQRLQDYFLAEEINDRIEHDDKMEAGILVQDGNFTWEQTLPETEKKGKASRKQRKLDAAAEKAGTETPRPTGSSTPTEPFHLTDINLAVSRHELLAVVGSVGSGKTSLLSAMVGDMRRTSGRVATAAKIAYCPQYAWIQNTTLRENIVFGREFNPEWYEAVIDACALQRDIDMLPDGDKTEIGERGITVSGGQKQRINIARAIYFNADIVLMDDPLSAVDAHVGKQLFDKAICGLLKDKCRVLATHQLHVLEKVDRVVWMEEGRIQAVGTFDELMHNNPAFAEMMREISTEKKEEEQKKGAEGEQIEEEEEGEKKAVEKKKTPGEAKGLMQSEERAVSSVSWGVYYAYIKASGSILVPPLLLSLLCLSQASNILTTLWLSWWISDKYDLSKGAYVSFPHYRAFRLC